MKTAPKEIAPIAFEDVDTKGDSFIDMDEAKEYLRQSTDKTVLSLVYKRPDPVASIACATCLQMDIAKEAGSKFGKQKLIDDKDHLLSNPKLVEVSKEAEVVETK